MSWDLWTPVYSRETSKRGLSVEDETLKHWDEFTAKGGGKINLGRFKKLEPQEDLREYHHNLNPALTHHSMTRANLFPGTEYQSQFEKDQKVGLACTKFGKGFARLHESNIKNEPKDKHQAHARVVAERCKRVEARRTKYLGNIEDRNGYNIISGQSRPDRVSNPYVNPPKDEGLKPVRSYMMNDSASNEANMVLRNSNHRFFMPQCSGPQHENRQKCIVNDGHYKQRYASLLEIGKNDLKSYRVEDQFSKSTYVTDANKNGNTSRISGLVESTVPGKFTPRKQAGNPSGNESLRATWGQGIKFV
jgi:hypothetical protein